MTFPVEVQEYKHTCARCTAEGLAEPKERCMGDCPSCGAFLDHDEPHTTDCTAEEDYLAMVAAFESEDT